MRIFQADRAIFFASVRAKHALSACARSLLVIASDTSTVSGIRFFLQHIATVPLSDQLCHRASTSFDSNFCLCYFISFLQLCHQFGQLLQETASVSREDGEISLKAVDRPEPITLHQ